MANFTFSETIIVLVVTAGSALANGSVLLVGHWRLIVPVPFTIIRRRLAIAGTIAGNELNVFVFSQPSSQAKDAVEERAPDAKVCIAQARYDWRGNDIRT